jgi:hypothetical protein
MLRRGKRIAQALLNRGHRIQYLPEPGVHGWEIRRQYGFSSLGVPAGREIGLAIAQQWLIAIPGIRAQ